MCDAWCVMCDMCNMCAACAPLSRAYVHTHTHTHTQGPPEDFHHILPWLRGRKERLRSQREIELREIREGEMEGEKDNRVSRARERERTYGLNKND